MAMTAAELQAATLAAERFEKGAATLSNLKTTSNGSRVEEMLNQQQPPSAVSGGSYRSEKPFSLHRYLAGYKAKNDRDLCPHEYDVLQKYTKAVNESGCGLGSVSGGQWFPLDINEDYGGQLVASDVHAKDIAYVKAVMNETRPVYDADEAEWLMRKKYVKDQSAFVDTQGATLVTPPVQGAVIPLIRPNAAFLAAGAQSVTLPPNGKMVFPRVTGAPNVEAIGEGQTTSSTDLTTGQMELTSKKIAGMVTMSEEASAYTSGTMDAIAQAELGRSLGLRMDAYAFYGIGSTQIPAGITSNTYTAQVYNVLTANPTAEGIGPNGNTLLPQYGDILPAQIEERSFGVDEGVVGTWIMRPAVYASAVAARSSAIATGDQQGPKVDILRRFAENAPSVFSGRRVVRTTNLRNNQVKGSSSNLTDVFFGIWRYAIMAAYGAINFQQGHNGVTFQQGQFLIRGTMFGDIGYQYPEAFLWYPQVQGITGTW